MNAVLLSGGWLRVHVEVRSLDADVVGFQEVQREVLDRHLQSTLKEMVTDNAPLPASCFDAVVVCVQGYGDLFFDSKTLGYGLQCKEGLLTAVRSDRFTVEHKATVDLDERVKKVARRLAGTRVSEDDIEALGLPGGNVGQVLLLRCRRSGRLLLFANVHIHYYWLRPDRQCLQISAMVGAIAECATQWGADVKETPVCFVGDFNTVPQIGSRTNPGLERSKDNGTPLQSWFLSGIRFSLEAASTGSTTAHACWEARLCSSC